MSHVPPVLEPPVLPEVPDVRLVALDLDGSLLDDDKRIHPTFWPLLDELLARGVTVCPASGRQYATLRAQLGRDDLVYVAENGAYVVRDGAELSADTLARAVAHDAVDVVRAEAAAGLDVGTVLCGKRSAYVERTDAAFLAQCEPYYALLEVVDDLRAVDDDVLKVAVYDFGPAEQGAGPALSELRREARVVVSGEHWVDVMSRTVDKGAALRAVQDALGVTREQTMAFGDYFNDLGMLDAAAWSFAMDNAHPQVRAHARFVAPSNNANGVVRTIVAALGLPQP
ncbi:Cof-type HAD-IIB family hydrolase [Cellulomonas fimi]|uniref:Cof-like hydrolase n=1 Tax=Cellulomonas fimi (strain ATCC 484 / DSM 20113 / JCM 1341 / CCUG 24087 / LMG 16345 / NBRC 15513 / NCIMB 8980 / NCTC 7547 / NRS-133) TaxID=590998 RepID=F4H1P8_CELFA|nr:Cof-type HAD-IIB family hydrolase [Cellulomonas fimi]AEE47468.1 Cof-like hydrolase [Cellulomonas fimi ATCC 484]NNH05555.1 Cof-type HAD-IIB family hydrolase [Cellulomonas fimi]VEH36301.1 Phosphatase YbjI [Cellulomonas fimi]